MDDRIFFGVLVYLLLIALVGGILPSDLFGGSRAVSPESDGMRLLYNDTPDFDSSTSQQYSFFRKALTFVFVPVAIDGIPTILGLFLNALNLVCMLVGVIYIYDKVRGIGS